MTKIGFLIALLLILSIKYVENEISLMELVRVNLFIFVIVVARVLLFLTRQRLVFASRYTDNNIFVSRRLECVFLQIV